MAEGKNGQVTHLKGILAKKIKIDPEQRKRNMEIVLKFVNDMVSLMKRSNDLFNKLFSRIYPTGSSFEGLRITDSNEFDIDLVLKFPFRKDYRKLQGLKSDWSCYAKYQLLSRWEDSVPEKKDSYALLKRLFIENDYIVPQKIRSWIQGIVDTVKALYVPNTGVRKVVFSESGPARTASLTTSFGDTISVDLVPVIEFTYDEWRKDITLDSNSLKVKPEARFMYLVPKPIGTNLDVCGLSDYRISWRLHLPEIEKAIIHDRGCVKPVIKLLKLLRDAQGWHVLSSYFLKTVVMWKVLREPESAWKENFMYDRLMEALKSLLECVQKRNIPHILFPEYNLLQKLGDSHAYNISQRIDRIIRKINIEPTYLELIFNEKI